VSSRLLVAVFLTLLLGCRADAARPKPPAELDAYLNSYAQEYQRLYYASSLAEWESNTHIVEGDSSNAIRTRQANEALARFVGSTQNIDYIKGYLAHREQLDPLQARQLEVMLYLAADKPQSEAELVARRIAAEAAQTETLYGYQFRLKGKPVTANDIDNRLRSSTRLADRLAVWESSKEIGPRLKPGILKLRDLRNQVVKALGYPDYFSYQVSDYGMSTDEMLRLTDQLVVELRPLYRELHTWARYELAKRYHVPVPDQLPAHWLPNRWAQDWSSLVEVKGLDVDGALKQHSADWVVRQGEAFYRSLGFDSLPASFWSKSSLYPLPSTATYKKNTHASAWHLDLQDDLRSLQSIENTPWWFKTAHHEFGHIYYFQSYTRDDVPPLLRTGANPAFHEGFGELTALVAGMAPYLKSLGVLPSEFKVDENAFLLNDALGVGVPFIFWSSGTMTHWEADVYAGKLPPDQWNARWWKYVRDFQGIEPPTERGEEWCDAATKTHINDTPCYYYSYAIAQVFKYQINDYVARHILHQPPQSCNYADNKEVGAFLKNIMEKGATEDWRKVLKDATGENLSTRAMVEYYQPLLKWLEEQNKGRTIGWE